MRQTFSFPPPDALRQRLRIFPVFLPFSGCPQRCVFCAQDIQTGRAPDSVTRCLERAEDALERLEERAALPQSVRDAAPFWSQSARDAAPAGPLELAFYGGTFTALPERDFAACLDFAARWRSRGLIGGLRCSTRPDAVGPEVLARLAQAGFACIELGIQSFSDKALAASRRGYDGETARRACALISGMAAESGMALGIQLLPGMPGHSLADAREDVRQSIRLGAAFVRLYPCLVLESTALADLWRKGEYAPWDLEPTVDFLAGACRDFQAAGIAVIRMGLAEEPGLAAKVLAGPRHPAIGGMARSRALYQYVKQQLELCGAKAAIDGLPRGSRDDMLLLAPRGFQGEFWGHRGELVSSYASLGLTRERVRWHDEALFSLVLASGSF